MKFPNFLMLATNSKKFSTLWAKQNLPAGWGELWAPVCDSALDSSEGLHPMHTSTLASKHASFHENEKDKTQARPSLLNTEWHL